MALNSGSKPISSNNANSKSNLSNTSSELDKEKKKSGWMTIFGIKKNSANTSQ